MRRRSGYGWLALIVGILFIILGIYSFVHPGNTLTWLVIVYGIIAVISGISDIIFYAKAERYTGFGPTISLISGIFSIMAGIMLFVYPNAGKWVMVLLLPIWFIAHCISRLTHLDFIRVTAGKFCCYFTLIINCIGIILGFLMIFRPMIALFSVGFLIGTYLILLGIDSIITAISRIGSR